MSKQQISEKLQKEIDRFFEQTSPSRISRSLRNMFLYYCGSYQDGTNVDVNNLLVDLYSLFELLDVAEDELYGCP